MAVDYPSSDISEFLGELLVDADPSLPGSSTCPDLGGNGNSTGDFPIFGDGTAENVTSSGDLDRVEVYPDPPVGSRSPGGDPSSLYLDDGNFSDLILKYINQLLMEEDKEDNPWFLGDETALRNTEKSLYDVLGEDYPLQLPYQNSVADVGCLVGGSGGTLPVEGCGLGGCGGASVSISSSSSGDPNSICSPGEFVDRALIDASYFGNESVLRSTEAVLDVPGNVKNSGEDLEHMLNNNDSVLLFKKGLEEASKFLPRSTELFRNLDDSRSVPMSRKNSAGGADAEGPKGLKDHVRDDTWAEEGRATKQTAIAGDEGEISDMFDKVLLYEEAAHTGDCPHGIPKNSPPSGKRRTSKGGKGFVKKQTSKSTVDLRSLLFLCAESVNGHDLRTANELLKQIRENSSASGNGSQRLAHYFANGLEARIAGNEHIGGSFFTSSTYRKISVMDMLKTYQAFITACPLMKFPIYFSGYMISKLAEKAKVLHVIDFGIGFGFHWPIVIQRISQHAARPPKLRITGIEYPVPGFRPARRIEETGRQLAKYCDRFGVPFEYNAVASQEWEKIKMEELKIRSGETIAVNCNNRLKNFIDDMGEDDSPRDAMLNLVRRINPELFVNSTQNGAYNSPFFLTRFREALFHYSGLYEMLDITMGVDSYERQIAEGEFYGREITNVIACEGRGRIERPETYKQGHARHLRAGFRPLELDEKIMGYLRWKIRLWYHKDFMMDEYNNCWMLLGWRGRITNVSSCWVPSSS
ncbi:hypothetical protein MLD38_003569 [Melastoma candidum]|uniref:Uncharacterized protein n=1 Tax=Melastoma candidum TaxID=119954 RepID=A0ACB9S4Z2_9MYRT|nr:hypothetical protein MLD38_003569 [Melastoma candidum]